MHEVNEIVIVFQVSPCHSTKNKTDSSSFSCCPKYVTKYVTALSIQNLNFMFSNWQPTWRYCFIICTFVRKDRRDDGFKRKKTNPFTQGFVHLLLWYVCSKYFSPSEERNKGFPNGDMYKEKIEPEPETRCGYWSCRPDSLQRFNNPNFLLAFLCFFSMAQGEAIVVFSWFATVLTYANILAPFWFQMSPLYVNIQKVVVLSSQVDWLLI